MFRPGPNCIRHPDHGFFTNTTVSSRTFRSGRLVHIRWKPMTHLSMLQLYRFSISIVARDTDTGNAMSFRRRFPVSFQPAIPPSVQAITCEDGFTLSSCLHGTIFHQYFRSRPPVDLAMNEYFTPGDHSSITICRSFFILISPQPYIIFSL